MKYRNSILLTAAILGTTLQAVNAQSIGINFGAGRADADLASTATAGVVPQLNWNNASGASGTLASLTDDSGASPAGLSLEWSSQEQWSTGTPTTDDGRLLTGWIAAQGAQGTVTVTGVPYTVYDLYVYINHDRNGEDVLLTDGSASPAFTPFLLIESNTNTGAPVTWTQQTTSGVGNGNYALFSGLSGDLTLLIDADDPNAPRGPINGIQIVEATIGDDDGDGLINNWEILHGLDPDDNGLDPNNNGVTGDPNNGADGDPDGDASPNLREQTQGTDPNDEDSDDDFLLDGVETGDGIWVDVDHRGTNPLSQDSDGDGLWDDIEDNGGVVVDPGTQTGTNPNLPDTDGDGLRDDWEVFNEIDPFDNGLDPNNNGVTGDVDAGAEGDPDEDGSDNAEEQTRDTDPQEEDTDGDTLLDGVETGDGNYVNENATGTDPNNPDTDGDTLDDDVEDNGGAYVGPDMTGTNPNLADTDGDGLRDDWEFDNSMDPFDPADAVLTTGGIALNFGAGRANAALFDDEEAGVFPQMNWNNLAAATGGPQGLVNELGETIGASVSWTMEEEWSHDGPGVDPNGVMFTGWFSANSDAETNTIDITGIPYSSYDLVFYFSHDRNIEDVLISEANGAFPDFVAREDNTDILAAIAFNQQVDSVADVPGEGGNFAIFTNLTAATLNLVLSPNAGVRGALTGMQIVNRGPAVASGKVKIISIETDQTAGTAEVTWESVIGTVYAIDGTTDLATPDWQEIQGNLTATQDTLSHTEGGLDFSVTTVRFYRVRKLSAP